MAAVTSWWDWLAELWDSLRGPPEPGTPEAQLEELRVGALLRKEAAKPPGQRDEELVHQLEVEHTRRMLANLKVGRCGGGGGVWTRLLSCCLKLLR